MTYTCDYGNLELTYSIESDVDGNSATIEKVDKEVDFQVDNDTLNDMFFICLLDYSDRQYQKYIKTGIII